MISIYADNVTFVAAFDIGSIEISTSVYPMTKLDIGLTPYRIFVKVLHETFWYRCLDAWKTSYSNWVLMMISNEIKPHIFWQPQDVDTSKILLKAKRRIICK
ncbi:hypothetical protein TNCV_1270081 [Trichonephila clavipes]|nr:hypothetical protein TNCV_1270081 [Trichonephila clavipes]